MKFCYTKNEEEWTKKNKLKKNVQEIYDRDVGIQVYEEEIISMERVYESLKRFRHKIKTVADEPHPILPRKIQWDDWLNIKCEMCCHETAEDWRRGHSVHPIE